MFAEIKSTNSRRSHGRLASVLVGSALFFAACGGAAEVEEPTVAALPEATESAADSADDGADNSNDGESSEDSGPELSPEEAQLAFSQCLEEQGVQDPFAGGGGGETITGENGDDGDQPAGVITFSSDGEFEAFQAAQEKCGGLLGDAFGEFEASPEQEAAIKDAELKFNQCMSEQGFEMSGDAIQIDEGDFEKIQEATKQCDQIFEELNGQFADESEGN